MTVAGQLSVHQLPILSVKVNYKLGVGSTSLIQELTLGLGKGKGSPIELRDSRVLTIRKEYFSILIVNLLATLILKDQRENKMPHHWILPQGIVVSR